MRVETRDVAGGAVGALVAVEGLLAPEPAGPEDVPDPPARRRIRWHLERAWAPLLFRDEAPPARTDTVAPPEGSAGAPSRSGGAGSSA